MKFSHSKLSLLLSCPMSYYLRYRQKVSLKVPQKALSIGSAVHWGLEHSTSDLEPYFEENGTFWDKDEYKSDKMIAECMVGCYLKQRDQIYQKIFTDQNGTQFLNMEEIHELPIECNLRSFSHPEVDHIFNGIIDLLFLTDKGFIIIDYKTSSTVPDWDKYMDQIYRYVYMITETFPDTPVLKVGVINLRKTGIRQKKSENDVEFLNRCKLEYQLNSDSYIEYHEYGTDTLRKELVDEYISNLSKMADTAEMIAENQAWFINFQAATTPYKSDYYELFYKKPDCQFLYQIEDIILEDGELHFKRDCNQLDLRMIDSKVLNYYKDFEPMYQSCCESIDLVKAFLASKNILFDEQLLNSYVETYNYIKSNKEGVDEEKLQSVERERITHF